MSAQRKEEIDRVYLKIVMKCKTINPAAVRRHEAYTKDPTNFSHLYWWDNGARKKKRINYGE